MFNIYFRPKEKKGYLNHPTHFLSKFKFAKRIMYVKCLSMALITQTPRHNGRARAKVYEESVGVALQEEPKLVDGGEIVSFGRGAL